MPIHGTGRARILTDITSDTDNKARKHCFQAIIMCYITLPIIISVMSSNFSLLFISSLFHEILSLSQELKDILDEIIYNKEETLKKIQENLNRYIDFDSQKLDDDIIREFVYRIYNMGKDKYIFIINLGMTESEIEKDSELNSNITCYVSTVLGNWKSHEVTVSQDISGEVENLPLSEQQQGIFLLSC